MLDWMASSSSPELAQLEISAGPRAFEQIQIDVFATAWPRASAEFKMDVATPIRPRPGRSATTTRNPRRSPTDGAPSSTATRRTHGRWQTGWGPAKYRLQKRHAIHDVLRTVAGDPPPTPKATVGRSLPRRGTSESNRSTDVKKEELKQFRPTGSPLHQGTRPIGNLGRQDSTPRPSSRRSPAHVKTHNAGPRCWGRFPRLMSAAAVRSCRTSSRGRKPATGRGRPTDDGALPS